MRGGVEGHFEELDVAAWDTVVFLDRFGFIFFGHCHLEYFLASSIKVMPWTGCMSGRISLILIVCNAFSIPCIASLNRCFHDSLSRIHHSANQNPLSLYDLSFLAALSVTVVACTSVIEVSSSLSAPLGECRVP